MTVSASRNASLDAIRASYKNQDEEKNEQSDALGRDAFLTMLVAQLKNQDPLNPMEGTDFSTQLAQFSQLEQLMNLNDSMTTLAESFANDSEKDLVRYMGKQVTGKIDSMEVEDGNVTGGFFSLSANADVIVNVTDESGKNIKTINMGGCSRGAHLIKWDGTDSNSKAVTDGTYKYTVLANTGSGYQELPTTVTGKVESIAYSNGNPYLVVQGVLVDPESLTSVVELDEDQSSQVSIMDYIGKTVSSDKPIISVQDGVMAGSDLKFSLETPEAATVKIYDRFDNLVRTIKVDEASAQGGENQVAWNGVGSNGYQVDDGLYYYTVETQSGRGKISVNEEVSGIKNANGTQYLVLKDSGRLVAVSSITDVSKSG